MKINSYLNIIISFRLLVLMPEYSWKIKCSWCPGTLLHQVINSHGINYVGQSVHCHFSVKISNPNRHSSFPPNQSACKGSKQQRTFSALYEQYPAGKISLQTSPSPLPCGLAVLLLLGWYPWQQLPWRDHHWWPLCRPSLSSQHGTQCGRAAWIWTPYLDS